MRGYTAALRSSPAPGTRSQQQGRGTSTVPPRELPHHPTVHGTPSSPAYPRIRVHYLLCLWATRSGSYSGCYWRSAQASVLRILRVIFDDPPTHSRYIGSHSPRMARDRVSTDNRPESRDRGLRLQTDWDPNLAPRPRFWSDLPIGAEPGFNTGSGTPLCDFGTAEVGRWWFKSHFNILYFSVSPHPPETNH